MLNSLLVSLLIAAAPAGPERGLVMVKGHRFAAEVAQTLQEQRRGLMERASLPKDRCMFFIYSEDGYRPIWMKNCLISLDVAWVQVDGTVVETAEHVPPCSPLRGDDCPTYGGTAPARHFVEFPQGTVKRLGLKKGDRIGWRLRLEDGTAVAGGALWKP